MSMIWTQTLLMVYMKSQQLLFCATSTVCGWICKSRLEIGESGVFYSTFCVDLYDLECNILIDQRVSYWATYPCVSSDNVFYMQRIPKLGSEIDQTCLPVVNRESGYGTCLCTVSQGLQAYTGSIPFLYPWIDLLLYVNGSLNQGQRQM